MNTNTNFKPLQKIQEGTIVFKDNKGRTVIRRAHSFFVLKIFETEIWGMCDGKSTIEEMALFVSKNYGVKLEKARNETFRFLKKLKEKDLIDWGIINENSFNKPRSTCK